MYYFHLYDGDVCISSLWAVSPDDAIVRFQIIHGIDASFLTPVAVPYKEHGKDYQSEYDRVPFGWTHV